MTLAKLARSALLVALALAAPKPRAPLAAPEVVPVLVEADDPFAEFPATVVETIPAQRSIDVDPGLKEIRVRYSREMTDKSWSWSQMSSESFPKVDGKPRYEKDRKTAVLPVKLEPDTTYAIWLNSAKFGNFKDAKGQSAAAYLLLFKTRKS